jgi:putative resolvase
MKAKDAMKKYHVSYNTIREWAKSGKIPTEILPSGRINYLPIDQSKNNNLSRANIIYSRVSTTAQKENLQRQTERIKSFCSSKGIIVNNVYEEIASALNYNRRFFNQLLEQILSNKVDKVVIEYKDRLLRIGFEQFETICKHFDTELIVIDQSEQTKTYQQEITEDLISIIHHYSMKLYSSRKRKKLKQVLESEDDHS